MTDIIPIVALVGGGRADCGPYAIACLTGAIYKDVYALCVTENRKAGGGKNIRDGLRLDAAATVCERLGYKVEWNYLYCESRPRNLELPSSFLNREDRERKIDEQAARLKSWISIEDWLFSTVKDDATYLIASKGHYMVAKSGLIWDSLMGYDSPPARYYNNGAVVAGLWAWARVERL